MAPRKKKKRLSKAEWKKLRKQRGAKSAEIRGVGAGSCKKFTHPAKWRQLVVKRGRREQVEFQSPGKTVYKSQKQVEDVLAERNMRDCLDKPSSSEKSIGQDESSESEFHMTDDEKVEVKLSCETKCATKTDTLKQRFFARESTQLTVNVTSKCSTKDCNGKEL